MFKEDGIGNNEQSGTQKILNRSSSDGEIVFQADFVKESQKVKDWLDSWSVCNIEIASQESPSKLILCLNFNDISSLLRFNKECCDNKALVSTNTGLKISEDLFSSMAETYCDTTVKSHEGICTLMSLLVPGSPSPTPILEAKRSSPAKNSIAPLPDTQAPIVGSNTGCSTDKPLKKLGVTKTKQGDNDVRVKEIVKKYYPYENRRYHLFPASLDGMKTKGDVLKREILSELTKTLLNLKTKAEISAQMNKLYTDDCYKQKFNVLKSSQGLFTHITRRKTDSVKALDQIAQELMEEADTLIKD